MEDLILEVETLPKDTDLVESWDVYTCNGYSLPSFAISFLQQYANTFEARPDDVYVLSYPKTGTTWLQEIVYLLYSNLNYEEARTKSSFEKVPFLEYVSTNVMGVMNMPSPRVIKSHLPYSLLPRDIRNKKSKMLYITRNPKDTVVSYFCFATWLKESQYRGTFSQFLKRFILNRPSYSPFLQHTLEFWNVREEPNILFLFYEDLIKDLKSNVQKIASFLNKSLSEAELAQIVSHCSFRSMSLNKVNAQFDEEMPAKFFRKGEIGDWKNYFTEAEDAEVTKWVEENIAGSGLKFTYNPYS